MEPIRLKTATAAAGLLVMIMLFAGLCGLISAWKAWSEGAGIEKALLWGAAAIAALVAVKHSRMQSWVSIGEGVTVKDYRGTRTLGWDAVVALRCEHNMETGSSVTLVLSNGAELEFEDVSRVPEIVEMLLCGLTADGAESRKNAIDGLARVGTLECVIISPAGNREDDMFFADILNLRKNVVDRIEQILPDDDEGVQGAADAALGRLRTAIAEDEAKSKDGGQGLFEL